MPGIIKSGVGPREGCVCALVSPPVLLPIQLGYTLFEAWDRQTKAVVMVIVIVILGDKRWPKKTIHITDVQVDRVGET